MDSRECAVEEVVSQEDPEERVSALLFGVLRMSRRYAGESEATDELRRLERGAEPLIRTHPSEDLPLDARRRLGRVRRLHAAILGRGFHRARSSAGPLSVPLADWQYSAR